MTRGLEPCPACGVTIRPAVRKTPHHETVECQVAVVIQQFEARGLLRCLTETQAKILVESGVPVERGMGGMHQEEEKVRRGARMVDRFVYVAHEVTFAPKEALRCASFFKRMRIPANMRREAIGLLWNKPDFLDAIEAVQRLSPNAIRSYIYQCVMQIREANGEKATG